MKTDTKPQVESLLQAVARAGSIAADGEIGTPAADKGDAVSAILSEMGSDVPAVYLGDDNSDEHAFEVVNINGRGLSVLVRLRYRATAARVWLKPPDEVMELLGRWPKACRERQEWNSKNSWAVTA